MKHLFLFTVLFMFVLSTSAAMGTTVTGVVVNAETLEPVAGVNVTLMMSRLIDISDEDGNFTFNGAPEIDDIIVAMKEGYEVLEEPITIEGNLVEVTLELVPFAVGSVIGTVIDGETSAPIANAIVSLNYTGISTATDESGNYSFEGVLTGDEIVSVYAQGYTVAEEQISVTAGETVEVNFELLLLGYGSITGVVTDAETSEPIAAANVSLLYSRISTTTDDNGNYSFDDVPAGDEVISASKVDYDGASQQIIVVTDETIEVNFELVPSGGGEPGFLSISGSVIDSESSAPIADALIILFGEGGRFSAMSNVEGDFSFYDIPAGDYVISTQAEYYEYVEQEIAVIENETVEVLFEMVYVGGGDPGPGSVSGMVIEENRTPVPDAALTLYNDLVTLETTTDLYGLFYFYDVADGDYIIRVEAEGFQPLEQEVTVAGETGIVLELTLTVLLTNVDDSDIVAVSKVYSLTNYPNPFNPTTTISFNLPTSSSLTLQIYDTSGRLIKSLADGEMWIAGSHSLIWSGADNNGQNVGSGLYFYKMKTEGYSEIKQMILLK